MPHQCTNCGHTFPDGSKEMLSGCPECGGNKFQFHPGGAPDDGAETPRESPPSSEPPEQSGVTSAVGKAAASVRDLVGSDEPGAGGTARDVGDGTQSAESAGSGTPPESTGSGTPSESAEAAASPESTDDRPSDATDSEVTPDATDREDTAQASARSDMVDRDEIPKPVDQAEDDDEAPAGAADAPDGPPSEGTVVKGPDSDERPDMEQLREELNNQFESIRIVAPGQYELNLMELYDREEYIIALQENGRYVIEVPDTWEDTER